MYVEYQKGSCISVLFISDLKTNVLILSLEKLIIFL